MRHVEINLSELQRTLDAQGFEVVENQKESVVGRKALADRTKGTRTNVIARAQLGSRIEFLARVQKDTRRGEAQCVQGSPERSASCLSPRTCRLNRIAFSLPDRNRQPDQTFQDGGKRVPERVQSLCRSS